jgi:hypothetical protein
LESVAHRRAFRVAIVTSIHPDFDSRIWKHAKCLAARGHTVHLICPWKIADGNTLSGVRFHSFARVWSRRTRWLQVPARLLHKLVPILHEIDLVHFHDIDILPWMSLIATLKPVVYDIHENYAEEMLVRDWIPHGLRKLLAFVVRWTQLSLAWQIRHVVLAVPAQERDFGRRKFNRIYIKNFASLELLASVADDYPSRADAVVFTGSHYAENGSLLLLDIAERALTACPGVQFYTADRFASSHFRDLVLSEIERRGLRNVVLLPNVDPHRLMSTLNRATMAILPNLRVWKQINAIPTKLFEYMAAALPVIASDLPYQTEVINGNQAGLLARPEDPDSFVAAIVQLVNNRAQAKRLGRCGQDAFRFQYSWEAQIEMLEDYYSGILGMETN